MTNVKALKSIRFPSAKQVQSSLNLLGRNKPRWQRKKILSKQALQNRKVRQAPVITPAGKHSEI